MTHNMNHNTKTYLVIVSASKKPPPRVPIRPRSPTWSRKPAMAESLGALIVILANMSFYSWTWVPFVVVGAGCGGHWTTLQITHVLRMICRWWGFFPPPHAHREFVWGLGLLRVAGLGYGNQARQQLEVGLAISGTNSKMSVVRMCRDLGLGFYIFRLGIWWWWGDVAGLPTWIHFRCWLSCHVV